MTPPSQPEHIGKFLIQAHLGAGGMGNVYQAVDPKLNRLVAIKTIRREITIPDAIPRFVREARACAALDHPNIVKVYEADESDGVVFIAMEYLEGATLADVLRQGAMTFEAKVKALIQIASALDHAHRLGVIHRDLKPANIWRLRNGTIKLLDFGLARLQRDEQALTKSGLGMGTLHYASPEQLRGDYIDGRTDIYAAGVIAYEMVAGRRPFDGVDNDAVVITRTLNEPPPPIENHWSRRCPGIEQIAVRAMAKSPTDRYQTAEDLRTALVAFLESSRDAIIWAQAETQLCDSTVVNTAHVEADVPREVATVENSTVPLVAQVRNRTSTVLVVEATPLGAAGTPVVSTAPAPAPASTGSPRVALAVTAMLVLAGGGGWTWWAWRNSRAVEAPPIAQRASTTTMPSPEPPDATPTMNHDVATATGLPTSTGAVSLFLGTRSGTLPRPAPVAPGLRYEVVYQSPNGTIAGVDPAARIFQAGDRVRFGFESNIDGYLYIMSEGSSGKWGMLFPHPDISGGTNVIRKGQKLEVPSPGQWLQFDTTPGIEHIFVYFCKEPLDQLPGFDRPVQQMQTLSAQVVASLRTTVRARDLALETQSNGGSVSTFVVNRAEMAKAVSMVIDLNHGQ